jgi:hypothetical protein
VKGKKYVTNLGYRRGEASVAVELIPFIQGVRIVRGGRFVVPWITAAIARCHERCQAPFEAWTSAPKAPIMSLLCVLAF